METNNIEGKKSKKGLWITLGIIIALAVGVGGGLFLYDYLGLKECPEAPLCNCVQEEKQGYHRTTIDNIEVKRAYDAIKPTIYYHDPVKRDMIYEEDFNFSNTYMVRVVAASSADAVEPMHILDEENLYQKIYDYYTAEGNDVYIMGIYNAPNVVSVGKELFNKNIKPESEEACVSMMYHEEYDVFVEVQGGCGGDVIGDLVNEVVKTEDKGKKYYVYQALAWNYGDKYCGEQGNEDSCIVITDKSKVFDDENLKNYEIYKLEFTKNPNSSIYYGYSFTNIEKVQ